MLKWTVNNTCRQKSTNVGKITRAPTKELHTKTSTPVAKTSQCLMDSITDLSKISAITVEDSYETPKKAVYYVASTLPTFEAEYSPCNFGSSFGILLNFQKPRNIIF